MSPKLRPWGSRIETDSDERAGIEAGRGIGTGGGGDADVARGGGPDGRQLSAGEATGGAVSGARRRRPAAWERGAGVESGDPGTRADAGAGVGAAEVQRRGRRAVWADAGGRASGE